MSGIVSTIYTGSVTASVFIGSGAGLTAGTVQPSSLAPNVANANKVSVYDALGNLSSETFLSSSRGGLGSDWSGYTQTSGTDVSGTFSSCVPALMTMTPGVISPLRATTTSDPGTLVLRNAAGAVPGVLEPTELRMSAGGGPAHGLTFTIPFAYNTSNATTVNVPLVSLDPSLTENLGSNPGTIQIKTDITSFNQISGERGIYSSLDRIDWNGTTASLYIPRPYYSTTLDPSLTTSTVSISVGPVAPFIFITLTGIATTVNWGGQIGFYATHS